jgi:3-hydroxyacyl-CoA dehydrogenase
MGAQISQVLAVHGYPVLAYDLDASRLQSGLELIRSGKFGLENSVMSGRLSTDKAADAISKIQTTTSIEEGLQSSDFILEAAFEDLQKRPFLQRIPRPSVSEKSVQPWIQMGKGASWGCISSIRRR